MAATTVKMPALGESVTEGTVTRWLKQEGDEVAVDEPLLEVSTDKVDTEIPSPVAGTLTKILVQEDDTVPVGADLAIIGGSGGGRRSEATGPAGTGAGGPPSRSRLPRRQPAQTAPVEAPTPEPEQAEQPATTQERREAAARAGPGPAPRAGTGPRRRQPPAAAGGRGGATPLPT